MSALETAVFWVEYVIRHKGAPHMHYPGANLNFLQKNSLDTVAVLFAVIYVFLKAAQIGFRFMWKCCRSLKKFKTE